MQKVTILSVSFFLVLSFNAYGQPGGQGGSSGGTRPSLPFVTVCALLSEGATCSFSDRDGSSISGTCSKKTNPMGKEELVCYNKTFFTKMKSQGPGGHNRPEQR